MNEISGILLLFIILLILLGLVGLSRLAVWIVNGDQYKGLR
jgi:hypothetical protein